MELMKLTDRVIMTIYSDNNQNRTDNEYVAERLREVADDIANFKSSDCYTTDENCEVTYDYECPVYGGFRMGVVSREKMNQVREFLNSLPQGEKHLDYYTAFDEVSAQLTQAIYLLTTIMEENEQ